MAVPAKTFTLTHRPDLPGQNPFYIVDGGIGLPDGRHFPFSASIAVGQPSDGKTGRWLSGTMEDFDTPFLNMQERTDGIWVGEYKDPKVSFKISGVSKGVNANGVPTTIELQITDFSSSLSRRATVDHSVVVTTPPPPTQTRPTS